MTENINENDEHYINVHEMFDEQIKCLIENRITDKMGEYIMLLAQRNSNRKEFVRALHIKEDLIMAGVDVALHAVFKFRPMRNLLTHDENGVLVKSTPVEWDGKPLPYHHEITNNPFAFYTTTIYRGMIKFSKREYHQRNIQNQQLIDNGLDADEGYLDYRRKEEEKLKELTNKTNTNKNQIPNIAGIVWSEE